MNAPLLAAARAGLLLSWTLLVVGIYALLSRARHRAAVALVRVYWRMTCKLIGFRVVVRGKMSSEHPTLYVANHSSYLDIPVLGSIIPGFFVAKNEVSGWPGIGFLARIARTVFVERRAHRSAAQRDELQRRLDDGESLILFPEGTSNDGNRVLPFKTALFSVAERNEGRLIVQPVSVAYTRMDGMPMGRLLRPFYAWYGDMLLAPHLWGVLGLGRVQVEVEFHALMTVAEAGSRKALAAHAHAAITRGHAAALAGRAEPVTVASAEAMEAVPVG